ncbi:MAG: crossover junction endodeoxyribonuclease RuvC [Cryomorphaceae bacterium]|nr:crossover junction endodeoxyribonuclease RuvC [Flavobacteriales bacterium]
MSKERIILGIDPGTSVMGYGIICCKGNKIEMLTEGVIKLSKYTDHAVRLQKIFERITGLIEEYHPDELAIEAPFYGKNVQSMLKLGKAQGVAIAAALNRDIPYVEYAPRRIKQAVTGNGNASKEQVAKMIQSLLNLKSMPEFLDSTDGLAAAICHSFQGGNTEKESYSSWKSYISKNPGKKLR